MSSTARNNVFISYSHRDAHWLQRLQTHLQPLVRSGTVQAWDDTQIRAGDDWRAEIDKALARAKVAVLLISADFLASDFIANNELPPLLARAQSHGTVILPLIVAPSLFEYTPELARYQAVNPPDKPLTELSKAKQEKVLVDLARAILDALKRVPEPETKTTTQSGERQNLNQDISRLQKQWDLLSRKLSDLQEQRIIETRAEEKFRLQHLIEGVQTERDQIDQRLRESRDRLAEITSDTRRRIGRNGDQSRGELPKTVKILFLAANPAESVRLALGQEARSIREKLRASQYRDAFEFHTEWAVRPGDLLQYFRELRPHIVHFSGHGSQSAELALEDDSGAVKPVSKAALVNLFRVMKENIRVVMLNACHSRHQSEAIAGQIDCTIGMNKTISDRAAIVFAAEFYGALGFGYSVRNAFEQGQTALMLEGMPEENTPGLIVRAGIAPAQVFLVVPAD